MHFLADYEYNIIMFIILVLNLDLHLLYFIKGSFLALELNQIRKLYTKLEDLNRIAKARKEV